MTHSDSKLFDSGDVLRANQILYDEEAHTYDSKNHVKSSAIRRYYEHLLDRLIGNIDSNWTVLDVGCGTGFLEDFLLSRGGRVCAVDATTAMLDTARAKYPRDRVHWIQADAAQLPFVRSAST